MSTFDFNTAETQRSRDVIPPDTIATLHLNIKPGDTGDGLWLKKSKDGTSEGLDCEFIVVDGEHAKRKFWARFTVAGETDGQKQAVDISRRTLRAVLESARGINPDDTSEGAKTARQVQGWGDFDGIRFLGRIGVEPTKGQYGPKNILHEVITPDRKNWRPVEQVAAKPNGAARHAAAVPPPAAEIVRPQWAR
jgi:hypothetical protein